jgi:hypothetical protein
MVAGLDAVLGQLSCCHGGPYHAARHEQRNSIMKFVIFALTLSLIGCIPAGPHDPELEAPGELTGAVDSIHPMDAQLDRFQSATYKVSALSGGAPDRDSLVRQLLSAVTRIDTAALNAMRLSQDEFAWLLFPVHQYRLPPYELDPALFWLQIEQGSEKGVRRLINRLGGKALRYIDMECRLDTLQVGDPRVRMWGNCVVRFMVGDSIAQQALFGSIIERDNQAKFVGYTNDF